MSDEVAKPNPDDECKICRGKFKDHKGTIHAFTPVEGDLVTKEQAIDRVRKKQGAGARPQILNPGLSDEMKRLLSVLKTKGVLDDAEVMFVMLGNMNVVNVKDMTKPHPEDQLQ